MNEPHLPDPSNHAPADPNTDPNQEQTMSMPPNPDRRSGLHPVNNGHLVMGIAFAGLVAIWALVTGDVVADDNVRWLLPVPWVVAGAVGLAVATTASFRKPTTQPHQPTYDETGTWTGPTEENR